LWDVFQCKVSERSLDHYHDSPLTTPSETSSSFSPSERRDSNDSQDVGRNLPTGKVKRLGKDEKLARQEGITEYITVDDIINLPMDEFNDRLDLHQSQGMTEKQRTIARDIRRRGKNKNAAQNCRKRANTRLDDLKTTVVGLKLEERELHSINWICKIKSNRS